MGTLGAELVANHIFSTSFCCKEMTLVIETFSLGSKAVFCYLSLLTSGVSALSDWAAVSGISLRLTDPLC